jgi:hypothetical protein
MLNHMMKQEDADALVAIVGDVARVEAADHTGGSHSMLLTILIVICVVLFAHGYAVETLKALWVRFAEPSGCTHLPTLLGNVGMGSEKVIAWFAQPSGRTYFVLHQYFDLSTWFPRETRGNFKGRTVVMLGKVGMGKSTIVEKVTGIAGQSSDSSVSFTRAALAVKTKCHKLQIIDTPGDNSMEDKLEHNLQIAYAMSHDPVSLILVTVKADMRIDNTVGLVREHMERFLDFSDMLCPCVTHMDQVTWNHSDFTKHLENELGVSSCIFVSASTPGAHILSSILKHCKPPLDIRITSNNFLKYFKINDNNMKIMKCVNDEVGKFKTALREFEKYIKLPSTPEEKTDLAFEFQAFMHEEITKASQRVADVNNFQLIPTANEIGHLANLTNQLKATLLQVRTLTLGYHAQAGVSELRKCPHCGLVWAKIVGCNGVTTCGNRVSCADGRSEFTAFWFEFTDKKFTIRKNGKRQAKAASSDPSKSGNAGCGKTITWSEMAPVQVPIEFQATTRTVSVEDVEVVAENHKVHFSSLVAQKLQHFNPLKVMQVTESGAE